MNVPPAALRGTLLIGRWRAPHISRRRALYISQRDALAIPRRGVLHVPQRSALLILGGARCPSLGLALGQPLDCRLKLSASLRFGAFVSVLSGDIVLAPFLSRVLVSVEFADAAR